MLSAAHLREDLCRPLPCSDHQWKQGVQSGAEQAEEVSARVSGCEALLPRQVCAHWLRAVSVHVPPLRCFTLQNQCGVLSGARLQSGGRKLPASLSLQRTRKMPGMSRGKSAKAVQSTVWIFMLALQLTYLQRIRVM